MNISKQLLSFSLATGLLTLIGCGDAGLCTRGEPGCACAETSPRCDNGACQDGMCPEAGGTGGVSGTGGSGGTDDVGCKPIWGRICGGSSTVAEACTWSCELYCQGQQQFCDSPCSPGFCDPETGPGVLVCSENDQGMPVGFNAAVAFCDTFESATCADYASDTCTPNCGDISTCENTCFSDDGIDWNSDGSCDDGGPDADYDVCLWGTDCDDCLPRVGGAPACTEVGGCCDYDIKCCGGADGGAHCLGPDGEAQCRADCTVSQSCDTGFECQGIVTDDDDDPATPSVPTGESACIPL